MRMKAFGTKPEGLEDMMKEYRYITLMEKPMIKDLAAEWFHSKWGIPKEAYMECIFE